MVPSIRGNIVKADTTRLSKIVADLARLDQDLAPGSESAQSSVIFHFERAEAYYVGTQVVALDREFRRTVSQARSGKIPVLESLRDSLTGPRLEVRSHDGGDPDNSPSPRQRGSVPASPQAAGLRLIASEPGSAYVLFEAIGFLQNLLISQPTTAFVNAVALAGPIHRIQAFFGRRRNDLDGVSARQAMQVIREFGSPDLSSLFGRPDINLQLAPLELQLPDGTIARGQKRIMHLKQHADGGSDLVIIE